MTSKFMTFKFMLIIALAHAHPLATASPYIPSLCAEQHNTTQYPSGHRSTTHITTQHITTHITTQCL